LLECPDVSMSLIEAMPLRQEDFHDSFESLYHILICRCIGDATSYDVFFEKQCQEQNQDAMKIKEKIDFFSKTDALINKTMLWCARQGHCKMLNIMNMLQRMQSFEITSRIGFGVCALDGLIFSRGIEIYDTRMNMSFNVNEKYENFMYAFWLVVNMHKICTDCIACLSSGTARDQSISECIENYKMNNKSTHETYKHMFYWAYKTIRDYIHLSVVQVEKMNDVKLQI
jgi:hypothetical protein